jgi:hypothetical protein
MRSGPPIAASNACSPKSMAPRQFNVKYTSAEEDEKYAAEETKQPKSEKKYRSNLDRFGGPLPEMKLDLSEESFVLRKRVRAESEIASLKKKQRERDEEFDRNGQDMMKMLLFMSAESERKLELRREDEKRTRRLDRIEREERRAEEKRAAEESRRLQREEVHLEAKTRMQEMIVLMTTLKQSSAN